MTQAQADGADSGAADPGVRVHAEDFGMEGPQGPVFHGVHVDTEPGSLIAIEGPSGSGRTCLLLALTGRMKSSSGHATVGRYRLPGQPAAVRRISALGPVPGVTDLDPALTVTEHLRERALLERRFGGSLRALFRPRKERARASRKRVEGALTAAGLDPEALPKGPHTGVRQLDRLEALRLSVALALTGGPRLLAVDDTDLKLSDEEREQAWSMLRSLARSGTTVLAVCSEAPEDAVVIRTEGPARRDGAGEPGGRKEPAKNADEAEQGDGAPESGKKGEAADALAKAGRA